MTTEKQKLKGGKGKQRTIQVVSGCKVRPVRGIWAMNEACERFLQSRGMGTRRADVGFGSKDPRRMAQRLARTNETRLDNIARDLGQTDERI